LHGKTNAMKRRFRTALVGVGKVGSRYSDDLLTRRFYRYSAHADVLAVHPGFEWGACVDTDLEALTRAQKRWNVPHCSTSIPQLLQSYHPEILVLATPPSARLDLVRPCHGLKAVLCEKPLGTSLSEAHEFLSFCHEQAIRVQVNFWRRCDAVLRRLAGGELAALVGRPLVVHGIYGNGLLNNGSHLVDLCCMLFGEIDAIRVLASPRRTGVLPVHGDSDVSCVLTFVGGQQVVLQVIDFAAYREVGLDIWGDQGRLEIWNEALTIRVCRRGPNRAVSNASEIVTDEPIELQSTVGNALYEVYDNLAAAVVHDEPLLSSGASAWRTAAVVETIMGAARVGDTSEQQVEYVWASGR
jgi:predicted dehydrogenase